MSTLTDTLAAVNELAFVADAYPYKEPNTIVVVLMSTLRDRLPVNKSVLTFSADSFTVAAVVEAYEREVVSFLADSLRRAERLQNRSAQTKLTAAASLCLN